MLGPEAGATEVLVSVEHLKKSYKVRRQVLNAVDDVSFELRRGKTLGLVGESGSGKSSVARCLLGLTSIDGGHVVYRGTDLHSISAARLRQARRRIQVVFQDPFSSLNRSHTVEQIVKAPLEAHRIGTRHTRRRRAAEIVGLVGLSDGVLARKPQELSGGQAQRVAIARALALEPELLVLDEAVSALDVSVQGQIMNLLRQLQMELALTYLFISHDLAVVRYMSEWVAVMHLGKIVEQADRAELFSNPCHPYTRGLMEAIPVADPVVARKRGEDQSAPRPTIPPDANGVGTSPHHRE